MNQYFIPFCGRIIFCYVNIYILPFYLSIDRHLILSTLWLLWIMLLWAFIYTFFCENVFISFWYVVPRNGIFGSYVNSVCNLLKNCQAIFHKELHHLTFLPAVQESSNFSTSSPTFDISYLSYSHSVGYEVLSRCSFDLHFLNDMILSIFSCVSFHVFIDHLYIFFGKCLSNPCQFLLEFVFLLLSCKSSLYILFISLCYKLNCGPPPKYVQVLSPVPMNVT